MRNPIRVWFDYNGRNMVQIASEPAGKMVTHYGKLCMANAGISILASAVIMGVAYAGYKIYEKVEDMKEQK